MLQKVRICIHTLDNIINTRYDTPIPHPTNPTHAAPMLVVPLKDNSHDTQRATKPSE